MLRHLHLADLTIERRAQGQQIHLALYLGDHRALALGQQALVARVQARAAALQIGVFLRVAHRDIGFFRGVLRLGQLHLRHRAASVTALVALQIAAGGLTLDLRLVDGFAGVGTRQHRIQIGAACLRFQAGQRRFFLGQLAAQFRTVDLGQFLIFFDHVAGDYFQRYGAGGDRVQDGAVGGNQATVGGDIADQVAAIDRGDADPLRVERAAAGDPATHGEADAQQ